MNVLAVGCHPDDLEIGCGGTLAKLASQGHEITMVHVANGNKGHKIIPPAELAEIREQEAKKAGSLIGAEVISLNRPDLMVKSDQDELISLLAGVIRRVRPDFIITHPPEDYMKDHMEVSRAVFDASFAATVPHYEADGGHPAAAKVAPIYYMDTLAGVGFLPTEYVDISDFIEVKIQMNDSHQSQIKWLYEHDGIDFLDFVRTVSKFRGLQCGKAYAEGFKQCQAWPRLTTERLLP
ncbi:PIG-L deacetylase family protein [Paenibacillus nasutitermitis]|uniref:GlcNAc-PI de-N-acetylase n=1 Tax=Paenibacillus nasutitermitis TaxID=1652958 RepID=A0A916YPI5_9BACL|nr:PIG-L deacetylase family protein [Paenibacillus nasutitermitis]GGD55289.1 GlcNAc-PI de-N-acetylase [Paenibacillus nasutitermitis]